MSKWFIPVFYMIAVLSIGGCSGYGGSWPSLSDPIPAASERERVTESSPPAHGPDTNLPQSPLTKSIAIKQLTATRAALQQAAIAYEGAYTALLSETDDKALKWRHAQLMLTRYSTALNKLDSIREADSLKGEPVQKNADILYSDTEAFIARERQKLMNLQP